MTDETDIIRQAMSIMGKRGGSARSEAKTLAARKNAKRSWVNRKKKRKAKRKAQSTAGPTATPSDTPIAP